MWLHKWVKDKVNEKIISENYKTCYGVRHVDHDVRLQNINLGATR